MDSNTFLFDTFGLKIGHIRVDQDQVAPAYANLVSE